MFDHTSWFYPHQSLQFPFCGFSTAIRFSCLGKLQSQTVFSLCSVFLMLMQGCTTTDFSFNSSAMPPPGSGTSEPDQIRQYQALRRIAAAREEADWMNVSSEELSPDIESSAVPLYSVNAVELPIRVLLYSLIEQAGLELVLSTTNESSVTFRAKSLSLPVILDRVTHQAGLRWSQTGHTIFISNDQPYLHSYNVEYINLSRIAKSSVGLATRVGSIAVDNGSTDGVAGFSNNSQSLIENQSNHQFWESLERDLQVLLRSASIPIENDESVDVRATVNRDSGVVTVLATSAQHRKIAAYLGNLQAIASRQVLIEATIVEVTLSDQFQAGVDWTLSGAEGSGLSAGQLLHGQGEVSSATINQTTAPSALLTAVHQSNAIGRLAATLSLLEAFGQVKILSRPQIIAINNQSAVLKVVDNRVYFTMSIEEQSSDDGENTRTSTDIHTVPVGLVMSVTPYIGSDNSVMLSVRPTISRILGFVSDPNPALASANVTNGVPEIQIREMESILKVANGEIAMIGGLMQSERNEGSDAVPWVSELPIVGRVFKQKRRSSRKTELLVFLQPTII